MAAKRDSRARPGGRRAGCPHPAGPCGSARSNFEITKVRRAKSPALPCNRKRQPKGKRAVFLQAAVPRRGKVAYWPKLCYAGTNGMLPCKGVCGMNLMISSKEYDFHSLIKVAEMAGLAGVVSFHPAGDDYLVTFPDCEAAPQMAADFRARLRGLENNIWNF